MNKAKLKPLEHVANSRLIQSQWIQSYFCNSAKTLEDSMNHPRVKVTLRERLLSPVVISMLLRNKRDDVNSRKIFVLFIYLCKVTVSAERAFKLNYYNVISSARRLSRTNVPLTPTCPRIPKCNKDGKILKR